MLSYEAMNAYRKTVSNAFHEGEPEKIAESIVEVFQNMGNESFSAKKDMKDFQCSVYTKEEADSRYLLKETYRLHILILFLVVLVANYTEPMIKSFFTWLLK